MMGEKSVETKFQISLAKPLFYDVFGLRESLVAAYTQPLGGRYKNFSSVS